MQNLNKFIDHTNLKPMATRADIEKLCADARKWDFASVCVNPCNIALAKELGIELTEADFAQPDGEISEDELETINGGGCPTAGTVNNSCYCAAAGGGGGKQKDEDIWGCACVAYGQGGDAKDDHTTCMCVLYGHGDA